MSNSLEVNTGTGLDKIQQYGWTSTGRPGDLRWINKNALSVDHDYQRELRKDKALEIASQWSWTAVGTLVVAERPQTALGTVLAVMDGQHRLDAALCRSDIVELPCHVHLVRTREEEARAFYMLNKNRRPPGILDTFHSLSFEGNPEATLVADLMSAIQREPSKKAGPSHIKCVGVLMHWAKSNPDTLIRMWPLLSKVCEGAVFHERIVEALLYIETHMTEGQSLTARKWTDRVLRAGFQGLLDGAGRAAAFYARGGPRVWAIGMVEVMNMGCRIKLPVEGVS